MKLYKNASLPIAQRVQDLLAQMTLEEKVQQLTKCETTDFVADRHMPVFDEEKALRHVPLGCGHAMIAGGTDLKPNDVAKLYNQMQRCMLEKTRLGIPIIFIGEGTGGVRSRGLTVFPQNIGVGAMFDEVLTHEMGDAIRCEMMALGDRMAFAPVVDVIRDHRYGRYEESFGEDVYLVTQNGMQYVKGLQTPSLRDGVAAMLKHFVAQGVSDGGRNGGPVKLTEHEILDQYAVPFAGAIAESNATCVMAAYHELNGIPCHASKTVLTDLLRNKLHFNGLIMSDGEGVSLLKRFQNHCETLQDCVAAAMDAGIELECDNTFKRFLKDLVLQGRIKIETVNEAVTKLLQLKFELGLFDEPYVSEETASDQVFTSEHIALCKKMARESIVLLKNDNQILPLSKDIKKMAVIGPLIDRKEFAYGDYAFPTYTRRDYFDNTRSFSYSEETTFDSLFHHSKTMSEAIREKLPQAEISCCAGMIDTYNFHNNPAFLMVEEAVQATKDAEVIIAVCGDISGVDINANDSGEAIDRVEITLPSAQRFLLSELKKTGKPIVLVLCNGRPLELSYEAAHMDAIVEAWKPGHKGAEAIADVLFGDYNPGGRLPVTLPKHLGQLPIYYSQHSSGKRQFWYERYLEMDLKPLYPFGYGLSYTLFSYEHVQIVKEAEGIRVSTVVHNCGNRDGDEVIQVYIRKRYTFYKQPERELKAYKRVHIHKDERVQIRFFLYYDSMANCNAEGILGLENCELDIMVGTSAYDIQHEKTFQLLFCDGFKVVENRVYTNLVEIIRLQ